VNETESACYRVCPKLVCSSLAMLAMLFMSNALFLWQMREIWGPAIYLVSRGLDIFISRYELLAEFIILPLCSLQQLIVHEFKSVITIPHHASRELWIVNCELWPAKWNRSPFRKSDSRTSTQTTNSNDSCISLMQKWKMNDNGGYIMLASMFANSECLWKSMK
jgi:hypothetical protein